MSKKNFNAVILTVMAISLDPICRTVLAACAEYDGQSRKCYAKQYDPWICSSIFDLNNYYDCDSQLNAGIPEGIFCY